MLDHAVGIDAEAGLALALGLEPRPDMHAGRVPPQEERLVLFLGALQEVDRSVGHLLIDGLHPLLGERPGVLDAAVGIGVQERRAARTFLELGVLRVVGVFRFVLRR